MAKNEHNNTPFFVPNLFAIKFKFGFSFQIDVKVSIIQNQFLNAKLKESLIESPLHDFNSD